MQEMTEAYDLKVLGQRLKEKGLIQAEDMAGDLYLELKQWYKESALLSKNPYDDLGIPFIKSVDPIVLPQIDKIDGKEG